MATVTTVASADPADGWGEGQIPGFFGEATYQPPFAPGECRAMLWLVRQQQCGRAPRDPSEADLWADIDEYLATPARNADEDERRGKRLLTRVWEVWVFRFGAQPEWSPEDPRWWYWHTAAAALSRGRAS